MAPLPQIVEYYTLTETANEIKNVASFVKNLLFGTEKVLHTENIVYKVRTKGRVAAPFVNRSSEAVISGGVTDFERNITAPNIRVKAPFEAADLLFTRRPGGSIFATEADVAQQIEDEVADHLKSLDDEIANAEEWLCAMALTGTINYASDRTSFSIDLKKPAANSIVASSFWSVAAPDYTTDILAVKQRMADEVSLPPTHALCGASATQTIHSQMLKDANLRGAFDTRNYVTGTLELNRQFADSGAIFIGSAFGMDFWGYTRSVTVAGVDTPMIRAKYIEFVHAGPGAQNSMIYAAIPDLDVMQDNNGRALARKRFSKSWKTSDPSELFILVHSRPFPAMKRPGSVVSLQVLA